MFNNDDLFFHLKKSISRESKIVNEMLSILEYEKKANPNEKQMFYSQINSLNETLNKTNKEMLNDLEKISRPKPVFKKLEKKEIPQKIEIGNKKIKDKIKKPFSIGKEFNLTDIEKQTLNRIGKKEKKKGTKKEKKPNEYIKFANRIFSNFSLSLLKKNIFRSLERDLVKSNLRLLPKSYVSIIFFTTLVSFIVSIFIALFFLFFNIGVEWPILSLSNEFIGMRFLKVFWIVFIIPIATFLFAYFYPSLEKKSIERRINQELPFVTIHMSSISESMVNPSKIFEIVISTKEYPNVEKEFIKLVNEMNVFGKDLVSALRMASFNSPSKKLRELFNGIITSITSGGSLSEFFEKRSQSLLLDYRLEREKYIKSSETFMDIYISVVIAAPMILMLLLMMIQISGLGLGLSTFLITVMMILGVSMINIVFIVFLHLRQPEG